MRLDTSQQMRLSQEMKLSPRLIQAMEILQLPMLALQERIDHEMESNPVLELRESEGDAGETQAIDYGNDRGESSMVVDDGGSNKEDFQRLDEMTSEYGSDFANSDAPMAPRSSGDETDRKFEAMANTPAPEESLCDYLLDQWRFMDVPADIQAAGRLIIGYIEEDGYLRTPLEDLQAKARQIADDDEVADEAMDALSAETLRTALSQVQALEPVGIGARDLKECLLLQLDARARNGDEVGLERQLVAGFLREIEMNRLPAIAKRLGRSIEDIKAGIAGISTLNPKPGLLIGQRSAPVIHPDVVVSIDENDMVVVRMADENSPDLAINDYYSSAAKDRNTDKSAKQFLKKNIRSAQWLIGAIAQRRHTVRRVAEEVFTFQRDFLDYGPEALRPLPMADVAEKVGVHVATVSRAVAEKYAQTPRGIFPLRMFFSGGTKTAEGEEMSWDAVKAKLQEIVDNENKAKPLSDDDLAKAMQEAGIKVARRTVAKYRGLMDIPPARKRKEY